MAEDLQRAIVALASRQQNNVTREQLLALGLGSAAIQYRTRAGHLFRAHLGVYAVGHPPVTHHEKAMAAVLACGPGAALSHDSALALWGLRKHWPRTLEVTTTRDRRPKGIKVHRSRTLISKDITRHFGIPVTTPARTVYDCAPRLTDVRLARAVNELRLSNHLTPSQLAEFLERTACRRLTPFVASPNSPTRSEFEDVFRPFCERYGFPKPQCNVIVAGHEVDALFPDHKLIVELDGYNFHSDRGSFERDRDRAADTLAAGFSTVHITWERLNGRPQREAARLERILDRLGGGL